MAEEEKTYKPRYLIVAGKIDQVINRTNEYMALGYEPLGQPFTTGNRIFLHGDQAWPGTSVYTSQIAQALWLPPVVRAEKQPAVIPCRECECWVNFECHRHSPQVMERQFNPEHTEIIVLWPSTTINDGCGEGIRKVAAARAIEEIVEAAKALLPYLPTKADMLNDASMNEGRASTFNVAGCRLRSALGTALKESA